MLLNWINSTGEFILADLVSRNADAQVAASGGALAKGVLIARFYGDFQFWVTLAGLLIQLFLVSRIYRWAGVPGALLVLPAIAAFGYGLIVFIRRSTPFSGGSAISFRPVSSTRVSTGCTGRPRGSRC